MFKFIKKIILKVLVVLVVIFLILFYLKYEGHCDELSSLNTQVIIEKGELNKVGLNTDTDSLNFGKVVPGSIVERSVVVKNDFDAEVSIYAQGNISGWVDIDSDKFDLNSKENQSVKFKLSVPLYAEEGMLNGEVLFCFRK